MTGSAIAVAYMLIILGKAVTAIPMKDYDTCMSQWEFIKKGIINVQDIPNRGQVVIKRKGNEILAESMRCISTGY